MEYNMNDSNNNNNVAMMAMYNSNNGRKCIHAKKKKRQQYGGAHTVRPHLILTGCTLMVGGSHIGSLSGAPCGCARLPMHIFGDSADETQPH